MRPKIFRTAAVVGEGDHWWPPTASMTHWYTIDIGTLPVNYALDLRKLSFQHKQSAHHISVMNLLFSLAASKEFELLCKNYSVIQPQAHGRFRACVWQAFVCYLASF